MVSSSLHSSWEQWRLPRLARSLGVDALQPPRVRAGLGAAARAARDGGPCGQVGAQPAALGPRPGLVALREAHAAAHAAERGRGRREHAHGRPPVRCSVRPRRRGGGHPARRRRQAHRAARRRGAREPSSRGRGSRPALIRRGIRAPAARGDGLRAASAEWPPASATGMSARLPLDGNIDHQDHGQSFHRSRSSTPTSNDPRGCRGSTTPGRERGAPRAGACARRAGASTLTLVVPSEWPEGRKRAGAVRRSRSASSSCPCGGRATSTATLRGPRARSRGRAARRRSPTCSTSTRSRSASPPGSGSPPRRPTCPSSCTRPRTSTSASRRRSRSTSAPRTGASRRSTRAAPGGVGRARQGLRRADRGAAARLRRRALHAGRRSRSTTTSSCSGSFGRLVPEKGVIDAVEILARVNAARPARLVVVGSGPGGGGGPAARAALGVADRLELRPVAGDGRARRDLPAGARRARSEPPDRDVGRAVRARDRRGAGERRGRRRLRERRDPRGRRRGGGARPRWAAAELCRRDRRACSPTRRRTSSGGSRASSQSRTRTWAHVAERQADLYRRVLRAAPGSPSPARRARAASAPAPSSARPPRRPPGRGPSRCRCCASGGPIAGLIARGLDRVADLARRSR